jgi:hypothetical protein
MAALNFPDGATSGSTYTANDKVWVYDGNSWKASTSNIPFKVASATVQATDFGETNTPIILVSGSANTLYIPINSAFYIAPDVSASWGDLYEEAIRLNIGWLSGSVFEEFERINDTDSGKRNLTEGFFRTDRFGEKGINQFIAGDQSIAIQPQYRWYYKPVSLDPADVLIISGGTGYTSARNSAYDEGGDVPNFNVELDYTAVAGEIVSINSIRMDGNGGRIPVNILNTPVRIKFAGDGNALVQFTQFYTGSVTPVVTLVESGSGLDNGVSQDVRFEYSADSKNSNIEVKAVVENGGITSITYVRNFEIWNDHYGETFTASDGDGNATISTALSTELFKRPNFGASGARIDVAYNTITYPQ